MKKQETDSTADETGVLLCVEIAVEPKEAPVAESTDRTMGPVEWLLLVMLSVFWGGSFFFGKVALAELRPFTVVLCRVGLAAAVLWTAVYASGSTMALPPGLWAQFLVMGLLNNLIPFSLIFYGQTRIASGLASIINAAAPVFTVVLAHFLTSDERLTAGRVGGVLFGLAGVACMIGLDALKGMGEDAAAQLAVLGAPLSYAFAGIYGRRFRNLSPIVTAAGQVTGTTAMMIPLALLVDRPWSTPMPGLHTWMAIGGLALVSTALAYIVYFRILAAAGATNILLVTFLIPVSAVLLGTTVLGERLGAPHFTGMGFIALGLAAIDGRPLAALRSILQFQKKVSEKEDDYAL
jgi:drug/metabolite transporter (DMT)-like permease